MDSTKNVKRGTANCRVLGEDADTATDVKRVTPLNTKRQEIQGDPQYQAGAIDKGRERRTTQLRRDKDTRPL